MKKILLKMLEEVDIKLKEHNYRLDITLAFVLYSVLIVLSILLLINFYWTKMSINDFQEKVLIYSKNINYNFKQKEEFAQKAGKGIFNGTISGKFSVNQSILKNILKTFLIANDDFLQILYKKGDKKFNCLKNREIVCKRNYIVESLNLTLKTEIKAKNGAEIIIISDLKNFLDSISNDIFNMFLIDKTGKVLYSNFIKTNTISDVFNQTLTNKIVSQNNVFITNDIYLNKIGDYKLVLIQNKKILNEQKTLITKISIIILLISLLVAIPFGYFFSTPLYEFYEKLNKRVKEELEKNREKEQLLMHQSKLASLGEMLGNIAHQWRHPLTRLSLLIQNLKMAYEMGKCDKVFVDKFNVKALEQINYMSNTIDDFTNFFKKDKEKQNFLLQDVIEDGLKLLESRLKNIEIIKNYQKDIEIFGLKTEFSQVILNILNNAVDVLKEREIRDKKIFIKIEDNFIEIEDNAGGIDDKIIDKIFEPYFTTKFQSQGTGIGLYMSKIIIKKHFNKDLEVYNSKNGAVFKIALF